MGFLYLITVQLTIPFGVELLSALCINILVTGWSAISWGTCVGGTMSGFLIQEFYNCSVKSFAVREVTCVVRYAIVFVRSATDVLLYCVAVVSFSNVMVSYYFISAKNAKLDCTDCTLAAQPSVFEVI